MKKLAVLLCVLCLLPFGMIQMNTELHAETREAERYFYKQLTNDQKHIYDTIVASAEVDGGLMSGNAKIPIDMTGQFANASATEADIIEYVKGLQLDKVTYAITRDHPELFWIYFQNVGFSKTYEEGRLTLTLDPVDDYYWDGITSEEQVKQLKTQLDAKVDEIVAVCKTSDDFQTLSCVNKWLIEHNTYNRAAADNTISYELSWSAISGLLSENDGQKGPVCYGYAMAFKLLCDRLGIPCIEVEGRGKTSESVDEGHAWNYVQMQDGKWYAVDTTWNDVGELAGQTRYFLVGADTITMSGAIDKFSLNHVAASSRAYPLLSKEAYHGIKGIAEVDGNVYSTLQEAIDHANGKPIDLLAEVDVPSTLNITSNIVINLRGNSIINRSDQSVTPLISVLPTGTLTLYDDKARATDPNYEGDVVQKNQNGTIIENNGKVILRSVQLESPKTLIEGNAYEIGAHSVVIATGQEFLNIGEIIQPISSTPTISVIPDEVSDKTMDGLFVAIKDKLPTLHFAYAKGGTPLHPITPKWNFKETGSLTNGETYTLMTNVYGYDVEVPVTYGEGKAALSGSVKLLGKGNVGEVLSVDLSNIKETNIGNVSYEWMANGETIANNNTNTYTIKEQDAGKSIMVKVAAQNYTGYLVSNAISIELPTTPEQPKPTPDEGNKEEQEIIIKNEIGDIRVQGKLSPDVSVVTKELTEEERRTKTANVDAQWLQSYNFEQIFDITLMKDSEIYTTKDKVTVTIHFNDASIGKELDIVYIADDGTIEQLSSTIQGQEISFETAHFSTYAIVSKKADNQVEKDVVDEVAGVRTGDVSNISIYFCLLLSGAATMFLIDKLKVNK